MFFCAIHFSPLRRTPRAHIENILLRNNLFKKLNERGLPWWCSGWDSTVPLQGTLVQTLAEEDTTWPKKIQDGVIKFVNSSHGVKNTSRVSLVTQWQRICLPVQETRVLSLVQKDPTCCGATEPGGARTTEAHSPRARQQERPLQGEALAPQLESRPRSL